MFRRRRAPTPRDGLTAFIDGDSQIEGKYTFSGTLMFDGRLKGEIASTGTLIIGPKALIHGDIRAGQVIISGEVVGNVQATERVELKGPARVFGDIDAPVVALEEGVLFEGHCRMTKVTQIAEAAEARDLSVVPLRR